jgi:hypothetical protein
MKPNEPGLGALKDILLHPQDTQEWVKLGDSFSQSGEFESARECYQRALQLFPGNEAARLALAQLPEVETPIVRVKKQPDISIYAILLNLALFVLTLLLAVYFSWSVTDLVWSLWVSSLMLGYAFIITSIIGMFAGGDIHAVVGAAPVVPLVLVVLPMNIFLAFVLLIVFGFSLIPLVYLLIVVFSAPFSLDETLRRRLGLGFLPGNEVFVVRLITMLPYTLFMLGFFSFHFLFFHAIHSLFLNGFFPLVPKDPFNLNLPQMLEYFKTLFITAISRYWVFVVISALSGIGSFINAFEARTTNMLFRPYVNVIRMHVMIIVFGLLGEAKVVAYALFPLLFFYFFPFRSGIKLLRWLRSGDDRPEGE